MFSTMQKYAARNSFSGVLGYISSKISRHLSAKGPKFWSAKGKGLKVPDAHPYPPLYRSTPPGDISHFLLKIADFEDILC